MKLFPFPKIDKNNPALNGFLRSASLSTEERLDPFPRYRENLEANPISWHEPSRGWDIWGYEEAVSVLRDHTRFSSERHRQGQGSLFNPTPNILNLDPPRHTALRGLVNAAFTPKVIRYWTARIQEIVDGLLDDMAQRVKSGEAVDLVAAFSYPLPVIVIAEMMGVPARDRERFKRWSDILVEGPSGTNPLSIGAVVKRKQRARGEMHQYFEAVLKKPVQVEYSLIETLLAAEIEGEKLSVEEIISFCILLLAAGNETTTNLITNAWRCLLSNPEALRDIQQDQSLIGGMIEETLRYYSPVQATNRIAKENVDLFGQSIVSGQRVTVWLGAANRDERVFTDPDRFDVHRSPNRHLAFGQGIHFCLGSPLAKLETELAITSMLSRFSAFSEAPARLQPIVSGFVFGVKAFPMQVA